MASERDYQLGQLALARGLISLPDLFRCFERRTNSGRALSDILVSEGLVTRQLVRTLEQRLDSLSQEEFKRELDVGDTIVLDALARSSCGSEGFGAVEGTWDSDVGVPMPARATGATSLSEVLALTNERRYEFVDELGRGGMGQVLRAKDRVLNREIAFKTVLSSVGPDSEVRERLILEAQLTGLLEHPSIVPVYELGAMNNGEPFYTMRVVRERSLEHILHAQREEAEVSYSLTQLVQVLRQVCLAVQYAHDQGVIHRDLKPENILIGSYGEVFVIDWGIAKIIREKVGSGTLRAARTTQLGAVVGTPQYMAPEQARGENDKVDVRTDVYALGAILYEILTLTPVFSAEFVLPLLFKVVEEQPELPTQRAPHRAIPRALEEICLRALSKAPDQRYPTAQAMADELNLFLEGVKDRERQIQQAHRAVEHAEQARASYEHSRRTHIALLDSLTQERQRVPSWAPPEEKRLLWELEQQAADLQIETERHFGEAVRYFGQALGHYPLSDARRALAALYWRRFEEAEYADDRATAAYFEGLVHQYNDGEYDTLLQGHGRVSVETTPPGAALRIYRYEDRGRRLVEQLVVEPGCSPITELELPHGSYLLESSLPEHVTLRSPFRLNRLQHEVITLRLRARDDIPADFVVVPGGAFLSGNINFRDVDKHRKFLPDFAIKRTPVTCAEYLEFLNALALTDVERALKHAPRIHEDGNSYFPLTPDGQFVLPERDAEGDSWHPDWPICMVNYHDAEAYAAWRSQRDGFAYRLPSADEWEKAARGVDGRLYPWGNHFDPSFCRMRESSRGKPMPSPVGAFPADISPYLVGDVAGNVTEWTSTSSTDDHDVKILQGAAFSSIALMCRLDWHLNSPISFRHAHYGFRLALSLS